MKNMKKLASLLLVLAMVFAMATTAFAAVGIESGQGGEATITVNLPTTPDDYTTSNTYKIYKVLDAEVSDNGTVVYKLVDGKTTPPTGFVTDELGFVYHGTKDPTTGAITPSTSTQLTDDEIAAIKSYVTGDEPVATVVTADGEKSFKVTGLEYGYYYVNTTTGSVVMVNIATPNGTINDKNKVPEVDKVITDALDFVDEAGKKAIAQLGTNVKYTATITTATGVENYVYHDTMESGLSFNNDVTIEGMTKGTDYTVNVPGTNGATFDVVFVNATTAALAEGTEIKIVYTAKVTNDALTTDPENNTAYLSYGREPGQNKTPIVSTDVYSAKFSVVKKDGEGKALADAGFVLKNSAGAYYKYTPAGDASATTTWYTLAEGETLDQAIDAGKVTENVSGADGVVPDFKGLPTGTYTLIESSVPEGYNKAQDYSFTVVGNDYSADNLEQDTVVTNNKGAVMPTTGGMGTTLFYTLGGILVLAAVVLLVTKKRMTVAK